MADFDSFDYNIEKKLPEWWKGFGALEPVNEYTQELISDILRGLLTTMGVVQPLNCWLSIPEEYDWYHHYKAVDDMLKTIKFLNRNGVAHLGVTEIEIPSVTTLFAGGETIAKLPNTKRKCHAKIKLKLLGTEIQRSENAEDKEIINLLVIKNADQIISLHNISSTSTIEISTEDNEILIDGVQRDDLIEGNFNKIKPVIKNSTYKETYIDNGQEKTKKIDVEDENKKTEIEIITSNLNVQFDLQIVLKKPTYTTEQNIKIATVSAFPIEYVRLYGYFCHPFNNQSDYRFLWEKTYTEESRTVFDRITKQYDCERFFIEVKFYGIGVPLYKGFPQEYGGTDPAFQPNPHLDKWGKIYGLPRRFYKTDITEDEEPYTFPKYYKYPIEQDYWYEERMINEYRYEDDSVNALFIKDDDFNNIGMLECIYPFTNDIWVYTETIDPTTDNIQKVRNEDRNDIPLTSVKQIEESVGRDWEKPQQLINKPISTKLYPTSNDVIKMNNFFFQTKKLKLSFSLDEFDDTTPKDIIIKGIELKFKTATEIQSKSIKLRNDCYVLIPYPSPNSSSNKDNYIIEKISIIRNNDTWMKQKGYYTIGGEDNLFQEKKITREQLFKGNNGNLEFELGFINDNNFLENYLYLEDVTLNIYYELIPTNYSIDVKFDKKQIDLRKNDDKRIKMSIYIENLGDVEVRNKELFIIIPPELALQTEYNSYILNLEIGEVCDPIEVYIKPNPINDKVRTGWYDILVICEDKVISNEILVRGSEV